MNSLLPAPTQPEPIALRILHAALLFALAVILIFLATLAVLASSSTLLDASADLFLWRSSGGLSFENARRLEAFMLWGIGLALVLPLWFAWRVRLRSWRLLFLLPIGAAFLGGWWLLYVGGTRLAAGSRPDTIFRIALVGGAIAAAIWVVLRFRRRSWWWLGGGYLAVAPVLTYLTVDDATLRHPTTIEEIAPAFPGAEKSYEVLMRYGKNHPLAREFNTGPNNLWLTIDHQRPGYVSDPKKAEQWRQWLVAWRKEIEADWAELAPVREWWTELNTFDRIGDLTPPRPDAEVISFSPIRSYSQRAIAIASLQALDGHGDAAFETLLPLIQVSRKLEPSARTLVRFMIARASQRSAIDAAAFVLDHSEVSAVSRARFVAALTGGSGGQAGARRLTGIEYSLFLGYLREMRVADFWTGREDNLHWGGIAGSFLGRSEVAYLLNQLTALVYNPNRTLNLYGDLTEKWQDLAARRELEKFKTTTDAFFQNEGRPRFKNIFGSVLLKMAVPAYSKVLENYWAIEDARTALYERLTKG